MTGAFDGEAFDSVAFDVGEVTPQPTGGGRVIRYPRKREPELKIDDDDVLLIWFSMDE